MGTYNNMVKSLGMVVSFTTATKLQNVNNKAIRPNSKRSVIMAATKHTANAPIMIPVIISMMK